MDCDSGNRGCCRGRVSVRAPRLAKRPGLSADNADVDNRHVFARRVSTFQEVLSGSDGRLAGMGSAFVFSALSLIPVQSRHTRRLEWCRLARRRHARPTPLFWTVWHGGFALMMIGALVAGRPLQRATVTQAGRRKLIALCVAFPLMLPV